MRSATCCWVSPTSRRLLASSWPKTMLFMGRRYTRLDISANQDMPFWVYYRSHWALDLGGVGASWLPKGTWRCSLAARSNALLDSLIRRQARAGPVGRPCTGGPDASPGPWGALRLIGLPLAFHSNDHRPRAAILLHVPPPWRQSPPPRRRRKQATVHPDANPLGCDAEWNPWSSAVAISEGRLGCTLRRAARPAEGRVSPWRRPPFSQSGHRELMAEAAAHGDQATNQSRRDLPQPRFPGSDGRGLVARRRVAGRRSWLLQRRIDGPDRRVGGGESPGGFLAAIA